MVDESSILSAPLISIKLDLANFIKRSQNE